MRKNFGAKPLMYPQPILVVASYDENSVPNALTAGGGISDLTQVSLILYKEHKTVKNILARSAFTVSMVVADYVVECDYLGIVSGNEVPDKLEKAGLHTTKSEFVDAPLIDELPVALECKLVSYDEITGRMVGEIVNVSADESVLDENGKILPAKLRPVAIESMDNTYLVLGEKIGNAYKDGEKLK
jgi:flavin reductase (DIM6/NTAB) family NADH-FMN oxidoreductase RutF